MSGDFGCCGAVFLQARSCSLIEGLGLQVWYDSHVEVDHRDIESEAQAAAQKGEFYGGWHLSGMQQVHKYLQKVMTDGGRVGSRVHQKLKGDLQFNNFGDDKRVGSRLASLIKGRERGSMHDGIAVGMPEQEGPQLASADEPSHVLDEEETSRPRVS